MFTYATIDDVKGDAPAETYNDVTDQQLVKLVEHATRIIRGATRAAVYDVTPAGAPTEPETIEAFRDATCAQVQAWVEGEVWGALLSGGAATDPVVKATSDNGASITFDTGLGDAAKAHLLTGGLALGAELILADAGLIGGQPGVWF